MIKGFDERFRGHGYEDFDFLIRLYELHGMLKKFNDFTLDKTERSPLFAVGFRRYLGEACLEVLLEKDMAFHLYHEKDGHEDYYLARQENYKKLIEAHSHNVSDQEEINSTLLVPFVSLCVNQGKSIHDYAIFFDNKPGHIDRFDTFKRRINFLLNK
jgi:predicted glycosyltransferase involved in capsule biosynthesis